MKRTAAADPVGASSAGARSTPISRRRATFPARRRASRVEHRDDTGLRVHATAKAAALRPHGRRLQLCNPRPVPSASNLAHRGLPFANPMSEQAVDRALGALCLAPGALVLDTGCGSGEMLLRALERDPTWRGLGVDLDADAIADARRRAVARLPGRDVRFDVLDAGAVDGAHDAVLNVGASHVHGGYPAALGALRRLVADGGLVVFGEGYWLREPSAAFLDALGGATADELAGLDGLRAAARAAGFEVEAVETASDADWAAYEETLAANAERAGGGDALAYAGRIRDRRALPDGTRTLGFALLLLRAARYRAGARDRA
jgi:SAM-dependent methyltransferase